VFKWESSRNDGYVILAIIVMLIGIQFQTLMILTALVFLYPGILNGDGKQLAYGAIAVVLSVAGLEFVNHWTMSFYPPLESPPMEAASDSGEIVRSVGPLDLPMMLLIGFGLLFAIAGWHVVRNLAHAMQKVSVGVGLLLGVAAQLAFQYHIAVWTFAATAIVALRMQGKTLGPILFFGVSSMFLAGAHVVWLFSADVGTRGIVFAKLMGVVSPWSFFNV
jgi:hypothetical protein